MGWLVVIGVRVGERHGYSIRLKEVFKSTVVRLFSVK